MQNGLKCCRTQTNGGDALQMKKRLGPLADQMGATQRQGREGDKRRKFGKREFGETQGRYIDRLFHSQRSKGEGGGAFGPGGYKSGLGSMIRKQRTENTYVWTSHRSRTGSAKDSLVHPERHELPCPVRAWLKAGLLGRKLRRSSWLKE
jgi:hypothetical protein